jgi:hypothetical protein
MQNFSVAFEHLYITESGGQILHMSFTYQKKKNVHINKCPEAFNF